MDEAFRTFCATIAGESIGSSLAAQRAVASVVVNRVGKREWKRLLTPLAVVIHSRFDAYDQVTHEYKRAWVALGDGFPGPGTKLGALVLAVRPIYDGTMPPTTNAQLYYSPRAQAALHAMYPRTYRDRPDWRWHEIEEVAVPGTEGDDFKFYRYRAAAKAVVA